MQNCFPEAAVSGKPGSSAVVSEHQRRSRMRPVCAVREKLLYRGSRSARAWAHPGSPAGRVTLGSDPQGVLKGSDFFQRKR